MGTIAMKTVVVKMKQNLFNVTHVTVFLPPKRPNNSLFMNMIIHIYRKIIYINTFF